MDRVIEDLQWFYKTLDIGGKTAEFYETQKNIILQTLVILKKQEAVYNQALEDCRKLCGAEKTNYADCRGCVFAYFENDFDTTICKLEQLKK